MPASPTSTTSIANTLSVHREWCIVGNGKLLDRWGLRWLVCCGALGGERSKLLLHDLLVCGKLIDRGHDRSVCFGHCDCCELTLRSQCGHLCNDSLHVVVVVFLFLSECYKNNLNVSLRSCVDAHCVQMMCVTFLDKRLQVGPNLVGHCFTVPILKVTGVEPTLEEKAHCIVVELLCCVQILSKDLHFLTIFDTPKQNVRGILWGIHTSE